MLGCSAGLLAPDSGLIDGGSVDGGSAVPQPIAVVLFTHIEDNTPAAALGTTMSRDGYLLMRGRLLQMATLAKSYSMTWVLQPDWKYLVAAQQYEDAATMASTGGKNV